MKTTQKKRYESVTSQRSVFQLAPIAAGCAILLMSSGVSYAQQAPEAASTNLNTVVVTGIRKGIEDAILVKKNSDSIVEAISAEDIGKLPDATVAESISRLPGVTAQRDSATGKASLISVRGMSPDFNGSLLNGREQASTGDSRGVKFDEFPAELLGSIVIYKTPDGALLGQGLASTIDMRTVRPLDFGNRQLAVNARKSKSGIGNDGGTGTGDRQALSYIDQFADRTIGVAIGITKTKDNGAPQNNFNSWGGWKANVTGTDANGNTVTGDAPGGFGNDSDQNTSHRNGYMGIFQFKPNKNFETQFDIFHSDGESKLKITGLEGSIGGRVGNGFGFGTAANSIGTLTNATVSNGVVTSGTVVGYSGDIRNHINTSKDQLDSYGWNSKLKVDEWTATSDLSYSKVVVDSPRLETTAGLPGNAAALGSISWTGFNGSNFADVKYTTSVNYADRNVVKLTDVDGWSGGLASPQAGYLADPHVTDQIQAARFSLKRDLTAGPIVNVDFGVNYTERQKVRVANEGRLVIAGNAPYAAVTMPGSGTAIAGGTGIPIAVFDPSSSLGLYSLATKLDTGIAMKDWSVTEKVTTFYAKSDLEGNLVGLNYRGNIGAQFVHSDQSSTGFNLNSVNCAGNTPATCSPPTQTAGMKYNDLLPSANVAFDLGADQVMRVAAGKTLSRADMGDMANNINVSSGTDGHGNAQIAASGGQPLLKPFRANAFDLSYEKYFGKKGYVSVAGFYKQLESYVLKAPAVIDFAPYLSPAARAALVPTSGPYAGSALGVANVPTNGSGGRISGVELSVNVPFNLVLQPLDGFGVQLNYSNTGSSISLPASGFATSAATTKISIPGMSKQVTNMRLYYEKAGFNISVAERVRSDFVGSISDFQDNRTLTYIKGETTVDLQASYEIQSGYLKGLSLLVQGNNMTNAAFQEYTTNPGTITNKIKFGKTYLFGVNYKL